MAVAGQIGLQMDMPAQPMGSALIQWAEMADISLGGVNPALCGTQAPAVRGRYTAESGLVHLLKGSACEAVRVDTMTYRLQLRPRAVATARVNPPDEPKQLEVVVTANRRPQVLGRAPTAISAVTASSLALSNGSLPDIAPRVPGMMLTNLGPGRDKILLRGVSDGVFTGRTQSTVGLYLDDAPITYNAPDPDLFLVDMARVEVLKGPQGALYGEGSISGVVRLITRAPDTSQLSGSVTAAMGLTEGGDSSPRIVGILNLPLVKDRVAVRLVGYRDQSGGYIHYSNGPEYKGNGTVRNGGRAAVLWKIDDDWNLTGSLALQGIGSKDSQYTYGGQKDYIRAPGVAEPHDNDFGEAALTLTGATSLGTLKITANHLHHQIASRYDADPLAGILSAANSGQIVYDELQHVELTTLEAALTSPNDRPVRWLAGVFVSSSAEDFEPSLSDYKTNTPLFTEKREDQVTNLAAFGELSADLAPHWVLTGGLRVARTDQAARSDIRQATAGNDLLTTRQARLGANHISHKLVLTYTPDQRLLLYVQTSNGYRSGGFNTTSLVETGTPLFAYDGDRLNNFELGAKWTLPERKLRVILDGYAISWKEIQSDQLQVSGLPETVNIGDGIVRGLEVEADWSPVKSLDLHAAALFAAPELTHANPLYSIDDDRGMPFIPRQMFSVSGTWRHEIGAGIIDVGAIYAYRDRSHLNFGPLQTVAMGGYGLVGASANYRVKNLTFGVRVENLTSTHGNSFAYGNPFKIAAGDQVTPLRPRTLYLSVSRDF